MENHKIEETEIEKKFLIGNTDWQSLVEKSKTIYPDKP